MGVLFLRGNLRIVPAATWFTALLLGYWGTEFLQLPFLRPAELWAIAFRLEPVNLSMVLLLRIAAITLLFWIYTQLRTPSVLSASVKLGQSASQPKSAFILGITFIVLVSSVMHFTRSSATGAKAVAIAQSQYGEEYTYHLTGISWSGKQVQASLTAYNKQEIKTVAVEWQ
ncbi:MAG: hypothetical protein AAGE59_08605 [Cyanobacteria bacterium P01_F01_bin.86]